MNKFNFYSLLLFLSIGLLSSCTETKKYESLVPVTDNDIILSVNLEQLLTKSDIKNQISEEEYKGFLFNIIKNSNNQKTADLVTSIIKDPSNSGIDISKNIYSLFSINEKTYKDGPEYFKMTFAVKDINKVEKLINSTEATKLEDIQGFKHFNNGIIDILLNENICIIFFSDNDKQYLPTLANPEVTLADTKYFKTFEKKNDFCLSMNLLMLNEISQSPMNSLFKNFTNSFYKDFEEPVYQTATINFEKGRIHINQEIISSNEHDLKIITENSKIYNKISHSYSHLVNEDPLFFFNMGINGEALYSYINKYFLQETTISNENKDLLKKIIPSINGDVTAVISNIDLNLFKMSAEFSVFVPTNDITIYNDIINDIKEQSTADHIIEETESYTLFQVSNISFYLGKASNFLYLTTNEAIAKDPTINITPSIKESRYYDNSNNSLAYTVFDLQKLIAMPLIQMGIASSPITQKAPIKNFLENINYLDAKSSDGLHGEAQLTFKNKEDNSLKVITLVLLELSRM